MMVGLLGRMGWAQEVAVVPDSLAPYVEQIPGTEAAVEMVYLPGGTFYLGSPETEPDRDADEGPRREATVAPFWMSRYEITYDQYAPFRYREQDADTAALPSFSADAVARPSPPYEDPAHGMGNQGFPAVGMTQWAALHYAKWLSDKTGHFYRLPTEAEWEYACRAGSTTAYAFGDDPADLDAYAWHYGNSGEAFHPVGEKEPNAWGLYDMHGNVAEWTLDQYEEDFYATLEEPAVWPWRAPTDLHPRTVRGGAYDDDPDALRCANRLKSSLNWKKRDPQIPKSFWWNTDSPFVGFRLVRPAEPPSAEEQAAFWLLNLGE